MKIKTLIVVCALFVGMFAPAAFAGVLTWQGTCIDCTQPLGSESNASALINVSGGTPVGLGRTNFDAVFW